MWVFGRESLIMKPSFLVLISCFSLSICGSALAQPVVIPDSSLKAVVESALGISDPNAAEMLQLTTVSGYNQGISDLTGLETATNLTNLYLAANQISDLSPLSELTKLYYIILQDNQISDISALAGKTNITNLQLQGNPISDISALSGLTSLTNLNLSSIPISDMSALSGLIHLAQLVLSSCQISDMSTLSGATSLTELWLDGNQISNISALAGMTNLATLSLNGNPINDLSALAGLTNLSWLQIGNTPISDISPLSGLTNLTDLGLYSNQISDISALAGLTKIKNLSLNNNQISDLSALGGMTSLWQVRLEHNQASDISVLSRLTNLSSLTLSDNNISDISALSGLTDLNYLYLDNNNITDIITLIALTKLRYLVIEGNPLCQEACSIYIPQIIANNPTMTIKYRACIECEPETPWIYVDDNAPNDLGPGDLWVSDPNEDGSIDHPFDEIQEGINAALDGDTVVVFPGTYHETLNLMGRNLHLNGLDPNVANHTDLPVIDAQRLGTVLTFDQAEDANCLVTGFVLTGGLDEQAGAISCIGSSPTIEHCLIVGNRWADPNGGAIVLQDSNSVMRHCTITDNAGFNGGAGILLLNSHPTIHNSILWNDLSTEILSLGLSEPNVMYCTVAGNWPGTGNLSDNPLLATPGIWVDPTDLNGILDPFDPNAIFMVGDYHLLSESGRWDPMTTTWTTDEASSTAIDAAAPGGIWILEPQPNGGRRNQGVYGGTTQASQSRE